MKHLVVLCGGRSAEHDVSFLSAASILSRLNPRKYRISVLGIQRDGSLYSSASTRERLQDVDFGAYDFPDGDEWVCLLAQMEPDIVFPVLHGPFGEDGTVQGALEILDIPYVGAGVCGSAVGMNKILAKRILRDADLPVLPFVQTSWGERTGIERLISRAEAELRYPVFVKPANLGSSVGVNKSRNAQELAAHVEIALQFDGFILVEQGIEAREIEVSVLGNSQPQASLAGEIIPSAEFYTYEAKYLDQDSRLLVPAPLTEEQMSRVRTLAVAGFEALQLDGMARMDFLLDKHDGRFWLNEANTIPGFTAISMYPKLWEASGLAYDQLLDRLIELGFERHQQRSRLSTHR